MKIAKTLGLVALFAIVSIAFSSCGGGSGYSAKDAEEMIKKSEEGKLEAADSTKCIDWVEAYTNESLNKLESAINDSKTDEDFYKKQEEADKALNEKYPKMDEIQKILFTATEEEMGKENSDRYQKVMSESIEKVAKIMDKAAEKDAK